MLPFSAASERNKDPILEVLRVRFAGRAQVLEIGSGTGQHAVHFARELSYLIWHPTEQLAYLTDLAERVKLEGPQNLRAPTLLDVRQAVWPVRSVDAIFTANTLHIMSWPEVAALFRGIGDVLAPACSASTGRFATPAGIHRTATRNSIGCFRNAILNRVCATFRRSIRSPSNTDCGWTRIMTCPRTIACWFSTKNLGKRLRLTPWTSPIAAR
jgi:SAM-dependent methyltransferase